MQGKNLYQALVSICFDSYEKHIFDVFVDSIYNELVTPISTTINIAAEVDTGNLCLNIDISTTSIVQLRAMINSIMYLTHTILLTLDMLKENTDTKTEV